MPQIQNVYQVQAQQQQQQQQQYQAQLYYQQQFQQLQQQQQQIHQLQLQSQNQPQQQNNPFFIPLLPSGIPEHETKSNVIQINIPGNNEKEQINIEKEEKKPEEEHKEPEKPPQFIQPLTIHLPSHSSNMSSSKSPAVVHKMPIKRVIVPKY